MSNGLLLLIRMLVSLAAVAVFTWVGWKLGGPPWAIIGLVFSCPLFAVAVARPLVELSHSGFSWLALRSLEPWQGRYYVFNNVQVRVYEHRGELWFAARDVMKAIGVDRMPDALLRRDHDCMAIPEARMMTFNLKGLEKFAGGHGGPLAGGIVLWAQREVVLPWERKRREGILE
jgi:hypothetical protein